MASVFAERSAEAVSTFVLDDLPAHVSSSPDRSRMSLRKLPVFCVFFNELTSRITSGEAMDFNCSSATDALSSIRFCWSSLTARPRSACSRAALVCSWSILVICLDSRNSSSSPLSPDFDSIVTLP